MIDATTRKSEYPVVSLTFILKRLTGGSDWPICHFDASFRMLVRSPLFCRESVAYC